MPVVPISMLNREQYIKNGKRKGSSQNDITKSQGTFINDIPYQGRQGSKIVPNKGRDRVGQGRQVGQKWPKNEGRH